MIKPKFTFEKIKFSIDPPTLKKAIDLYETGKIKNFKEADYCYSAKVQGTNLYNVEVDFDHYDSGDCNCYIGKQGDLCKHMVAVAIYALFRGDKIPEDSIEVLLHPVCSNKIGELNETELVEVKEKISQAVKLIRAYSGPSSTWFHYQNKLSEAVNRLTEVVSKMPVSYQTTDILIRLLVRLDKKLVSGGVDDSDGTVGGFITDVVEVLKEFAKLDEKCLKAFNKLKGVSTCFGWENSLLQLIMPSHLFYITKIRDELKMYGYQVGDIEYTSNNYDEKGKLITKEVPTVTSKYGEIGIIEGKFYLVMIFEKELLSEKFLEDITKIRKYKLYGFNDFLKDIDIKTVFSEDFKEKYIQIQYGDIIETDYYEIIRIHDKLKNMFLENKIYPINQLNINLRSEIV